ncbi:Adrenodoxin [Echinococcus granulosus]|uniref:Adrenodoxin n=1 Tax=Echinococcus granulosus TaxID=6210 RepID=W6UTW0_ECHGR|nr:Adrenodoxin [Echinococcus granulosus]EUB64728.1 Adrenodoxin [Echinococcus granulosus]
MRSNYFQKHAASQYSTDSSNVVQLTFEWLCNGVRKTVPANVGDTLLEVILDNELDIDGFGACGGELACSTCHLILSDDIYNKLPNPPSEEETDLLDLAPVITDTVSSQEFSHLVTFKHQFTENFLGTGLCCTNFSAFAQYFLVLSSLLFLFEIENEFSCSISVLMLLSCILLKKDVSPMCLSFELFFTKCPKCMPSAAVTAATFSTQFPAAASMHSSRQRLASIQMADSAWKGL